MAKVHGKDKEFACQMCPKKFVYNYQLKTHMLTHAQLKNKDKQSPNQEAAGVSETTLLINMDSEGFEQEALADDPYVQTLYQCSLCQQVFDTYRALQKHCAQHSQNNTFDLKGIKSNVDTDCPLDIALVSDNALGSATSFGTSSGNEPPQIFLELSSDHQDAKPSSSMAIGANIPLNSLEGTILKEQDGQH